MSAPDLSSSIHPTPLDARFAAIDWHAPWLSHINGRELLAKKLTEKASECSASLEYQNQNTASLTASTHDSTVIADMLNLQIERNEDAKNPRFITHPITGYQSQPLTFVSQNALPEGEGYEAFIGKTGKIPTRDNLHDLFNGSIWLTFPKTKALLNFYHMQEIAAGNEDGKDTRRGRVRDTITVFDENGAVLITAKPEIGAALIDFDWQNALVAPREQWDDVTQPRADASVAVYVFGHALLEQLIAPRKPLCAHSVIIDVDTAFFGLSTADRMAYLDTLLVIKMDALLSQDTVTPRQLSPLPILGVPHFWENNVNPSFYQDEFVFRNGRRKKTSQS